MKALLMRWFLGSRFYRLAHKDGYDCGYRDGRDSGYSDGISRVPQHTRTVMYNLDIANSDRARLTREVEALKAKLKQVSA